MSAVTSLFLRVGTTLVALSEQPYDAEDVLQGLLADHPELLPSEAINPADPPRFLLLRREAPVAGAMEIDHLFIDHLAVLTLVETKRGSDTRVRREVVAQMLDYASSAREWSSDTLSGWLEKRCEAVGVDPDAALADLDHAFESSDAFWERATQNLRDGKVRLLFISDGIPAGLRRIVEFLNEQMQQTEVLAAEVRQFVSLDGKELLQTSLVGQTERAREVKGQPPRPPALAALVEDGHIGEGTELWLRRERLPVSLRPGDPSDPRLRVVLKLNGGQPRLLYHPPNSADVEELTPSKATDRIRREFDPGYTTVRARAVNDAFAVEPGGLSLGELAIQHGLWPHPINAGS